MSHDNPALRFQIKELVESGITSTKTIADRLQCNPSTVRHWRQRFGIANEASNQVAQVVIAARLQKLGYADLDAAVLANSTMPVRELARMLCTSVTTVIRRRAKLGITTVKQKQYHADWSMPLPRYQGKLHLLPDEHWCPCCGDNTIDLEDNVCMCCGNKRLLDARLFLREGEYEV